MGLDSKYCNVTVHQTNTAVPLSLIRLQSVGDECLGSYQCRRPMLPYNANAFAVYDADEVFIDDTADIAVLSEDEPLASAVKLLNPLSRMTMRWTDQLADEGSSKAMASSTTSACTTPDLMDSPTLLMAQQPMMTLVNSFLDVDTNGSDEIMRPTIEELGSLMAATPPIPAGVTLDMLPNKYEASQISPYLRDILLHNQCQQENLSRLVLNHSDEGGESDREIEDDDASSITTDDYDEDLTNHSVDIDSIRQTRQEAAANFKPLLLDLDRLKPPFCTTKALRRVGGSARNVRGLNSPRMMSQVTRPRKATVPDRGETTATLGNHMHNDEVLSVPMYHGQELHLAFKTTTGQTVQVQGHPKRHSKGRRNPFSRRVRCHAVQCNDALDESDTLRIIGHTTDGLLCGGDCVSFARTDGMVLRIQKMSKKLTFSNKIDVRAQFIITGVPDRTPVTSTSNFYLQSMYDHNKTVGYLPSRRVNNPGCFAMYIHRSTEDKVEPVQFFQRTP
ncbi:unnamed protein product [Peronospora destructor]|uniref:Uncharacterized protein n=1 Tax=Peronospora destructor TaxID=86335 RepID=A0AAV0V2U8_9STRA|nr:unnamed protein product [Peronospora destructor]